MGNRAHVIFKAGDEISPAIYLHWNGGPESVYAFLDELKLRGVRSDASYSAARMVQIIGEFFGAVGDGATLSLGITNGPANISDPEELDRYDGGDNGVYVVEYHMGRAPAQLNVLRFAGGAPLSDEAVELEARSARGSSKYAAIGEFFASYRTLRTKMNLEVVR